jgi:hypothetical protein
MWTRQLKASAHPHCHRIGDNMPIKRRVNKRREQLCEDGERWLRGEPSGFFEFKDAKELAALWAEFGDPKVAVWDDEAGMPRARKN